FARELLFQAAAFQVLPNQVSLALVARDLPDARDVWVPQPANDPQPGGVLGSRQRFYDHRRARRERGPGGGSHTRAASAQLGEQRIGSERAWQRRSFPEEQGAPPFATTHRAYPRVSTTLQPPPP